MTNMIRKAIVAIKGGPGAAGLWVQAGKTASVVGVGRLFIDRQGGVNEPIASDRVRSVTAAAVTLTGADDGVTILANGTATVVATLPRASVVGAGFRARILVQTLPSSGAGTTLTPNAADKFAGNGFNAKTAGQTLVNTAATDAIGDYLDVVSDGAAAGTWFVLNKIGTWA